MLSSGQRKVGKAILTRVAARAKRRNWTRRQARRVARMAIMCALTESNLRVYGNVNNPTSKALLGQFERAGYATGIGSDHASVGPFQQQVPWWGTEHDCMDPSESCRKFMDGLAARGYDKKDGPPLAERIQAVQVSGPGQTDYSPHDGLGDGLNYRANRFRAWWFVIAHWNFAKRTVK